MEKIDHAGYLALRAGAEVLEADPHGDKVLRLRDGRLLKMFRRKRWLSSALFYPYARRFVHNARVLARLGVPVPRVLRLFSIPQISRHAVLYEPLPGQSLRDMVRGGLSPERARELRAAFTELVIRLHRGGVYFRSLHLGNVICSPDGRLGLIDFSDMRVYPWALGKYLCTRNLQRMQQTPGEKEWVDLPAIMNAASGPSVPRAGEA